MATGMPEDLRREVERNVAEELRRAESIVIPSVAQVEMNIEPRAIPRKTADPQQMISVIQNEFSSRYDPSNIRKYVPAEAWVALSAPRAMEIAIANGEIVQFVGGWLRLENLERMTPIDRSDLQNRLYLLKWKQAHPTKQSSSVNGLPYFFGKWRALREDGMNLSHL
jgi:hypothetical protein